MADKKSSLTQIAQAVLADDGSSVKITGNIAVGESTIELKSRVILDYTTTDVDVLTWVELLPTVGTSNITKIEIFDSSGEILELGTGVSGSEISNIYVRPGGNGLLPITILAGTRLSVKSVSGTANSGSLVINLYGNV